MTSAPPPSASFHLGTIVGDVISASAIIATILGWLPLAAAFAGMIWYCIQIWESPTVQHWWTNRKMVRKARKITRLRAKERVIVAQLEALETIRVAKAEARERVATAQVEAAKQVVHEDIESAKNEREPPSATAPS